ncbi:hypothetical protein C9374_003695 [Naegleria lovaniensis]|uniref:Transcription initiation factor IIA subunit 2 n=1 Tax=Naegleria lovaniensis TaxID=51637 RepID=A0AA88H5A4_NAELO|nr:uncharacterized protein C9374_003695 [Naegleria lovaniensis]KAG2393931.1 hypothetical protein C9374_003695 [Naegleria lovaniensis]
MSNNNSSTTPPAQQNLVGLYRHGTLGVQLQKALDQLKDQDKVSDTVVERVMKVFDKSICNALATKLNNKMTLKADQCITFNFNNNVYVWTLKDVQVKLGNHKCSTLDYVKIVACDGTTAAAKKTTTSKKRKK